MSISRLNHTALGLAVYASQWASGTPCEVGATQDACRNRCGSTDRGISPIRRVAPACKPAIGRGLRRR